MVDLLFIDTKNQRMFTYENVTDIKYTEQQDMMYIIYIGKNDRCCHHAAVNMDTIVDVQVKASYYDTDSVKG